MARKKLSTGGFVVPVWEPGVAPGDLKTPGIRQEFDTFMVGNRVLLTVITATATLDPVSAAAQYRRDLLAVLA